ncbi:MAG: branched-chain amino acid ABC transporter permease [Spirochaetales bacterium]|nr:branched-chain amino acid ABC transporter permease [Spirochaetales bacterium]
MIAEIKKFAEKNKLVVTIAVAALLLLIPLILGSPYLLRVAIMICIFVILSSSLNLIIGFTGMFSLAHAAFYGIGAYCSALLSIKVGLPFLITLPLAGILAGLIGAIIGLATLRLRETFLVFGTLAFGEIVRIVIMNWTSLTRGPMGIPGIPFPKIFGFEISNYTHYYYMVLFFAVIVVLLIRRLYNSRVGRAFIALREDETGAASMGVNVFAYKVWAFALGCFFAGIAGALYAHFVRYISADQFGVNESFAILTMVALGGTGSIIGPIVGAVILMVFPELFRFLAEYRMVLYGLILIVIMMFKPEGIAGFKGMFPRDFDMMSIFKRKKSKTEVEEA